ncbi:hypothetical protein EVAR_44065_1 [Eumeta japonica]|uniref:Uncharacterized protein n=1 Tax=Eumeta variegata TaxID=151549 RepID=A0A4C1X4E8_EUMVA|nr:hypothetical protein EVAR_44065_1 [Eumeta japonica]
MGHRSPAPSSNQITRAPTSGTRARRWARRHRGVARVTGDGATRNRLSGEVVYGKRHLPARLRLLRGCRPPDDRISVAAAAEVRRKTGWPNVFSAPKTSSKAESACNEYLYGIV